MNAITALADDIRKALPGVRGAAEGADEDAAPAEAAPSSPPMTAAARKLGVGLSDAPSPEPAPPRKGNLARGRKAAARALLKSPKRMFHQ
eukprot:7814686-Alexandrium_andersonii.AAC.1